MPWSPCCRLGPKRRFRCVQTKRTRMRTLVIPVAPAVVANSPRKVPKMIFSSAIRRTATALVLTCVAGSTIVGLLHEPKTPPLAWTSIAIGAVALVLVLTTRRSPKRDAGLFAISGMGSGVFTGAATVGFPGSIPIWLWTIGAICLGTMSLVVDAEASENKSVSSL